VIFVFVDESAGAGNYVLVHSTALNEIFDEKWRERLGIN
jgi:hydrogenase maturation factor